MHFITIIVQHGKNNLSLILPTVLLHCTFQVVTPQKCGDVYWYDLLPNGSLSPTASCAASSSASQRNSSLSSFSSLSGISGISSSSSGFVSIGSNGSHQNSHYQNLPTIMAEQQSPADENDDTTYDTPKPAVHISFDAAQRAAWSRTQPHHQHPPHQHASPNAPQQRSTINGGGGIAATADDESYDIPRPVALTSGAHLLAQHNITPSSSNSSLLTSVTSDSLSLSSMSNRSSMAIQMGDYDVPRARHTSAAGGVVTPTKTPTGSIHTPIRMPNSTYDVPHYSMAASQHRSSSLKAKELPLELSSALETLSKLQNEATLAVSR